MTLEAPHEQVRLPADGPPGAMTVSTDTDVIVRHSYSLMQLPLEETSADDDLLSGGAGSNAFVFDQRSDNDIVTDFQIGDVLRFEGDRFSPDQLSIETVYNDTVITFGKLHNVEVTLTDVDLPGDGYTVTQDPDALIITYDDKQG